MRQKYFKAWLTEKNFVVKRGEIHAGQGRYSGNAGQARLSLVPGLSAGVLRYRRQPSGSVQLGIFREPLGKMNVLLACERFGIVRDAFIARGHNAISCDILPTVSPGPHYHGNVQDILRQHWDLIIAFPPCTHLANSGAKHFAKKRLDGRQQAAIDFFLQIVNAPCEKIAVENPVGIMSSIYRKPDQIIQPYYFGDSFKKTTCLWLKNLPKLQPTEIVSPGEFVIHGGKKFPKWYSNRTRNREKTFQGIANAMAQQWG